MPRPAPLLRALLWLLAPLLATSASAAVHLPTGEFRHSVIKEHYKCEQRGW